MTSLLSRGILRLYGQDEAVPGHGLDRQIGQGVDTSFKQLLGR